MDSELEAVGLGIEEEGDVGVGLNLLDFGGADIGMEAEDALVGIGFAEDDDTGIGAVLVDGGENGGVEGVFSGLDGAV